MNIEQGSAELPWSIYRLSRKFERAYSYDIVEFYESNG